MVFWGQSGSLGYAEFKMICVYFTKNCSIIILNFCLGLCKVLEHLHLGFHLFAADLGYFVFTLCHQLQTQWYCVLFCPSFSPAFFIHCRDQMSIRLSCILLSSDNSSTAMTSSTALSMFKHKMNIQNVSKNLLIMLHFIELSV